MHDAHQSLLQTRMRSADMVAVAASYAHLLGRRDVRRPRALPAGRPWERLDAICSSTPNLLTQMLLRGANGAGYTNYPHVSGVLGPRLSGA